MDRMIWVIKHNLFVWWGPLEIWNFCTNIRLLKQGPNFLVRPIFWNSVPMDRSAANLMSVSNFPSSQGCHFPTEENRLVFKSQGSHVPTSQNLIPVPTKVAWEYLARVGRTREYYSICIKYPGFLHTWGIYPLGGDWYPSKCCCFPAAYVEVIQNGTE